MNEKREWYLRSFGYALGDFKAAFTSFMLKYMAENNLTQNDMAAKLNISKGRMSKLLHSGNNHRIDSMMRAVHETGHLIRFNIVNIDQMVQKEKKIVDKLVHIMKSQHTSNEQIDFLLDNRNLLWSSGHSIKQTSNHADEDVIQDSGTASVAHRNEAVYA